MIRIRRIITSRISRISRTRSRNRIIRSRSICRRYIITRTRDRTSTNNRTCPSTRIVIALVAVRTRTSKCNTNN